MTPTRRALRSIAAVLTLALGASGAIACSSDDEADDTTTTTSSTVPPTTAASTGDPVGGGDSTDITSSIDLQATELDTLLQFDSYSVQGTTITGRFNAANRDADVDSQCTVAMDTVEPGTNVVIRYPDRAVTCETAASG